MDIYENNWDTKYHRKREVFFAMKMHEIDPISSVSRIGHTLSAYLVGLDVSNLGMGHSLNERCFARN
jgi:hypothetical protein